MITIKDIAALTNISPSTVSIVLRGNGNARKISKETQARIIETAQKLGYTPNIQAKVLREGMPARSIITLFWASDIRVHILSRFLNGLQTSLFLHDYPCEIQVKPYKINQLKDAMSPHVLLSCNGIIICNSSETDLAFLESQNYNIPIVLYNRYSAKYATVNMDDKAIGSLPAQIFSQHKKKRPAVLKSPATFNGMNIRTNIFEFQLHEKGISKPQSIITEDSMHGGYDGAMQICQMNPLPDCLLCTSDSIALGALKAFYQKGILIPDQLEIISIGNGNREAEEFSIPSLSVIKLPMEEMADACLQRLYRMLSTFDSTVDSIEFPIQYVARESCPE